MSSPDLLHRARSAVTAEEERDDYGAPSGEVILPRSARPLAVNLHADVEPIRSISPSASHSATSHAGATSAADATTSSGPVDSSSNFRSCSGVKALSSAGMIKRNTKGEGVMEGREQSHTQLAALAPEMLELLQGIEHFADGFACYHDNGPAGQALREWINAARSLIAKAEDRPHAA